MTDSSTPDAESDGPLLVADYAARPPRLRPLLALWDTSVDALLDRLAGITDEEWLWEPGPGASTVRRVDGTWRGDAPQPFEAPPGVRTIAWTAGHLGELGRLRADWTTGDHRLQPEDLTWPGTAAEGAATMRDGLAAWRRALEQVDDADLDTVGRCAFPHGLDPHLPLIDIAWWNTRELVHHAADIATVRDLYAVRATSLRGWEST